MKYDEFLAQVQRRAALNSHEEADRATRATIETLAECLTGDGAESLAAQLPQEMADFLVQASGRSFERISQEEFFRHVGEREGCSLADASYHARVVLGLVNEAVTMGEIENLRAQVPAEIRELFMVENEGELPGVAEKKL